MEVVNLVFALLGHVLASVLYVARRIKFSSDTPDTPPAVAIDRSSILERKDELKELWEKKMMTSEHQVNIESSKKEEEDIKPNQHNGVLNGSAHKMPNGDIVKTEIDIQVKTKDIQENNNDDIPVSEPLEANKTDENKLLVINTTENGEIMEKEDHSTCETENVVTTEHTEATLLQVQNGVSEIETEEVEIKEQIFTSTFHQAFVVTKKQETTVVEEQKIQIIENTVTQEETQDDFEEIEARIEAEESHSVKLEEVVEQQQIVEQEQIVENKSVIEEFAVPKEDSAVVPESPKEKETEDNSLNTSDHIDSPDSLETIEIPDGDDFEHYIVLDSKSRENEVITNGEFSSGNSYTSMTQEETVTVVTSEKITSELVHSQNEEVEEKTFDDHFVLDTREAISPTEEEDKKDSSNKKTRIHTLGVQKTEQPYSTCTTETKIAMEIREMREREEELKKMRERQAQISPVPPPVQKIPVPPKTLNIQKPAQPTGLVTPPTPKTAGTPGYRVSSVFGPRGISQQQVKDESKYNRSFNKESPVEKEIRLAKDREEELRKQKGLPPREDDSYVKPSHVKSSQAKAFGKMINAENSKLIATAKIQHEIEEQTLRELALRESGHIQTLSSERTDAKVTKLKTLEVASPECTSPTFQNGVGSTYTNGMFTNGHISPDSVSSKRSTPSPTGSNYSSQYTVPRNVLPTGGNKGISMQKFIASRGKETTFAPPRNGPFHPKTDYQDVMCRSIPEPGKLKRTVSVESKIQQEILEMKLREEELKLLHTGRSVDTTVNGNGYDNAPKSPAEYHQNGGTNETEEMCPRRSNLIAQWEQRIMKSEGKA